jgi:hypothetical protein
MPTTLALSLVWRNRSLATIFSMGGDELVPSGIKMSVVFEGKHLLSMCLCRRIRYKNKRGTTRKLDL